jgi:arsenate reductase
MTETKEKLKILFLCTGNSCRSQIAEGWTKHLKADSIDAYSAGVFPKPLDPRAVQVMAEAGVDISNHHSKRVVIHVGFNDPPQLAKQARTENEALNIYRRVRDEIKSFVEELPQFFKKSK